MTAGQHIDYDALQLEALRGVVKGCLAQVSRSGLLGDHHFYIAFNTQAPGVGMSKRLKEKYPVEMTIVLQHRFWDLAVDDDRFEVKLTFDGIPERLVVPFKAVKVFYDPSVPYGLQFEESEAGPNTDVARNAARRPVGLGSDAEADAAPATARAETDDGRPAQDTAAERLDRRRTAGRKPRPEKPVEPRLVEPVEAGTLVRDNRHEPKKPQASVPAVGAVPSKPALAAVTKSDGASADGEGASGAADSGGAKIFDLSKFRGKK